LNTGIVRNWFLHFVCKSNKGCDTSKKTNEHGYIVERIKIILVPIKLQFDENNNLGMNFWFLQKKLVESLTNSEKKSSLVL
jgi:hypothetical protein